MGHSAFKAEISPSEKKALLFLGLCALLTGTALMGKAYDGSFAPLLVLTGLFAVCLCLVKHRRSES